MAIVVDDALRDALLSDAAALVKCTVEGATLKLAQEVHGESCEVAFRAISEKARADLTQPCLAVVRGADGHAWSIVSFTPETVSPRIKMAAAAARDALKRLNSARVSFGRDYHVTTPDEFTWESFAEWRADGVDKRFEAMSTMEKQLAAVKAEEETERQQQISQAGARPSGVFHMVTGMSSKAFKLGADAEQALASMAAGASGPLLLCALNSGGPDGPTVDVVDTFPRLSASTCDEPAIAAALVDATAAASEPRLAVLRVAQEPFFSGLVVHVPETAPPRLRVAYSSSKAAFVAAARAAGCVIGKTVETSDADDLRAAVGEIAQASRNPSPAGSAHSSASSPSDTTTSPTARQEPGIHRVPVGGVALPIVPGSRGAAAGSPGGAGARAGVPLPGLGGTISPSRLRGPGGGAPSS